MSDLGVPPPVPPNQRYPQQIRDFVTYVNQDGQIHNLTTTNPYPPPSTVTTDLTLDAAAATRDIETEIVSIETVIGARPFMISGHQGGLPTPVRPSIGNSIQWLHSYKSPGRVDSRNAIIPPPGPSHSHPHQQTTARDADDHPMYMPRDGRRPFTAPVTAPGAWDGDDLITLAQAQNAGLTVVQAEYIIQVMLNQALTDPFYGGFPPCTGPDSRRWKMTGGYFYGYADGSGNVYIDYGDAAFSYLATFVYMKMPYPGGSHYGYRYRYEEDQLVLIGLSPQGALVQFIEDNVVDRRALVSMTWMAMGL